MSFQSISLQKDGPLAVLTIERPEQLNALNRATIHELSEALEDLSRDQEVRAVILTGRGEKAFVAGADIKEFADYSVNDGTELAAQGQEKLFDRLENFNKPVIAAINGFALGGGLELAMACQMRIASDNARMGLPEVSLGVIPGYGGTQRLAQLIGKGRAIEMIATAEMVTADRAYQMGLVNQVSKQENLMELAQKMGAKVAKNGPKAVHSAIKCVNAGFNNEMNGYKVEIEEFGKCFGTAEFKEGTSAFLAKRKPQF